MKNKLKIVLLIIVLLSSILISACSSATKEKKNVQGEHLNVYEETVLKKPEDLINIMDIEYLKDKSIAICGGSKSTNSEKMFVSYNDGKTWSEKLNIKVLLGLNEDSYCNAIISENGTVFCEVIDKIDDFHDVYSNSKKYFIVKLSGEVQEIEITLPEITDNYKQRFKNEHGVSEVVNGIGYCNFISEKYLILVDYNQQIYLMDISKGVIVQTYSDSQLQKSISGVSCINNTIIVITNENVTFFDLNTGEKVKSEDLEKDISKVVDEGNKIAVQNGFIIKNNHDDLMILNNSGIYNYTSKSNIMEKSFESNDTVIMDTNNYVYSVTNEKDDYFILARNMKTNEDEIYYYKKTDEHYDSSITIWSLRENNDVYRAASEFQSNFKNVKVNIDIAMSATDGITVSDAIKALNTETLAGEGPDVIILDQLPIDSYVDKNLLLDLSDFSELNNTNEYFSNILNAYKKDEKVYAIPTRYTTMLVTSNKDIVDSAHSLKTLISKLEEVKSENPDKRLFESSFNNIVKFFYYVNCNSFIKNDKIDDTHLKEFFINIKKIYDLEYNKESVSFANRNETFFMSTNYYDVAAGKFLVATDTLNAVGYQFAGIHALINEDNSITYDFIQSDLGNQYKPNIIVGINSMSNNIDLAKEFIKATLSEGVQNIDTGSGMPVNLNSFKKSLSISEEYDIPSDHLTLHVKQVSEVEKEEITDMMNQLDKLVDNDEIIMDVIFEQLEAYISDKISIDEAIDFVINNLELYYAE